MILVTVGTHERKFNRLVQAMDELTPELDEEVVMQIGSATYQVHNAPSLRWASWGQMEQLIHEARLIVSHAGAGSILSALRQKKTLLVAPRRAELGEALDDHQFQLARVLAAQGKLVLILDPTVDALRDAIAQVGMQHFQDSLESGRLKQALRQILTQWQEMGA